VISVTIGKRFTFSYISFHPWIARGKILMPPEVITQPWKFRAEPFKIVGNLYFVGNLSVSSHLVETDEGLILFDTGYPQTLYLLLESIRELGFEPKDIKQIFHTHAHYDHFGGTKALVDLTNAKTAIGKIDVEILTKRPELTWCAEYGVEFYEHFFVDTEIEDGQKFTFGKTNIECSLTPGHTAGAMSYFFNVKAGKRKGYIAALHGGVGLNTLSKEYLTKYTLPGTLREAYLESCKKLHSRPVDILLGSHPDQNDTFGKRTSMTDLINPFIDQHAWSHFIDLWEKAAREMFDKDK
jgi:metallo-beta-lactamase class B